MTQEAQPSKESMEAAKSIMNALGISQQLYRGDGHKLAAIIDASHAGLRKRLKLAEEKLAEVPGFTISGPQKWAIRVGWVAIYPPPNNYMGLSCGVTDAYISKEQCEKATNSYQRMAVVPIEWPTDMRIINMKCSECGFSKSSLNHYTGSADYDHPFKAAQCPTCFAEVKQPVTRCIRTCHSHVPSPCVTCTDKWHMEDIPKKCDNCGAPVTLPRELCDECRGN